MPPNLYTLKSRGSGGSAVVVNVGRIGRELANRG
jgi:hypothetical protein